MTRATSLAVISVFALVAFLGIWRWGGLTSTTSGLTPNKSEVNHSQWQLLEPRPITAEVIVTGTIEAGQSTAILAPFDGVIRERRVQFGAVVQAGDTLLVMDTSEIDNRLREAQLVFLRANVALDGIRNWDASLEVTRARRAVAAAEAALMFLDRQMTGLQTLLGKGIISKNELDGAVQLREAQSIAATNAREELNTTLARGKAENRQSIELEYQNAKSRLADVITQSDGAVIVASVTGVLVRPPVARAGLLNFEPGSFVSRGTPLFSLADTTRFIVTSTVDEVEVNSIAAGQTAVITGDAFPGDPPQGTIISVSAEATIGQVGDRAPVFEVRTAFSPISEAQRRSVRLGMSARVTIVVYRNEQALIVPPRAVSGLRSAARVRVRGPRGSNERGVAVVLGRSFIEGIEIISGVQAGSEVAVPY